MKPLIGITPSPSQDDMSHGSFLRYAMASTYVEAVIAAGGIPVVLPPQLDHTGPLLNAIDGLLLSGGGDIEPWRFGESETHPATYGMSPLRDQFELDLLDEAFRREMPIFCICRGIQVLNVALGGTLIQDIPTQHDTALPIGHRQQESGKVSDDVGHEVAIAPESPFRRLYPDDALGVNSYHHQAIARLGSDLASVAVALDGIIEAVVMPSREFVLGVQWHPEMMFKRHPEQLRLFQALVEVAAVRRFAVV
jgi:putative glutamine amidotransferase